jgi:hypothetical protein
MTEAKGRLLLFDISGRVVGYIDVKDETTYKLAELYMKVFAEQLDIKKAKPT